MEVSFGMCTKDLERDHYRAFLLRQALRFAEAADRRLQIAVTAGKVAAIVTRKQPAAHRCQKLKTQTMPDIAAKKMADYMYTLSDPNITLVGWKITQCTAVQHHS